MTRIPIQLQERGYRFCLIPKGKKNPSEDNWTTTNNYEFDNPKLDKHIKEDGNYGVVCGFNGLVVLDSDTPELTETIIKAMPETFKVKTGTGNFHFYFRCPTFSSGKIPLTLGESKRHYGDLQAWGSQVVGAHSLHPNGNRYEVVADCPIAVIDKDVLMDLIAPFRDAPKMDLILSNGIDIPISNIVDLSKLKKRGNEYQGTHPYHGSTTEWNFTTNPTKNVWHCFRCSSGGGPIQLIGIIEGIVPCNNPILRGDDFNKAMEIAEKRYGYKPPFSKATTAEKTEAKTEDKHSWTLEELLSEPDTIQEYVVSPIIPKGHLIMIAGRPESCKSLFSLFLGLNIATGKNVFNYKTMRAKCIYLDAEMNKVVVRERIKYMSNEYDFKSEGFFQWVQSDMKGIMEETGKMDYDVIIIDSYRRFLRGAENDSEVSNMFFKNVLKPLLNAGKTVILIHHFKKRSKDMTDDDLMEMFRGSSDTVAQLDVAFAIFKGKEEINLEGKTTSREFSVSVVKNRLGLPLTPFSFIVRKNDKDRKTDFIFLGEQQNVSTNDKLKEVILKLMADMTIHETKEIVTYVLDNIDFEIDERVIRDVLSGMVIRGTLERKKRGEYRLPQRLLDEYYGMER